jgi:hypothetical protein
MEVRPRSARSRSRSNRKSVSEQAHAKIIPNERSGTQDRAQLSRTRVHGGGRPHRHRAADIHLLYGGTLTRKFALVAHLGEPRRARERTQEEQQALDRRPVSAQHISTVTIYAQ